MHVRSVACACVCVTLGCEPALMHANDLWTSISLLFFLPSLPVFFLFLHLVSIQTDPPWTQQPHIASLRPSLSRFTFSLSLLLPRPSPTPGALTLFSSHKQDNNNSNSSARPCVAKTVAWLEYLALLALAFFVLDSLDDLCSAPHPSPLQQPRNQIPNVSRLLSAR